MKKQKIETKQCRRCGKIKPISEFYVKKNGQVFTRCKECCRLATQERLKSAEDDDKTCKVCSRYPCFKGIDTMSSNLALTCHDFNQIIN